MIVENNGLDQIRDFLAKDGQLSESDQMKEILSVFSNLETTDQKDADVVYSLFCELIDDKGYSLSALISFIYPAVIIPAGKAMIAMPKSEEIIVMSLPKSVTG